MGEACEGSHCVFHCHYSFIDIILEQCDAAGTIYISMFLIHFMHF